MAKKDFRCTEPGCGKKMRNVILSCFDPPPPCKKCGGETAQDWSEYKKHETQNFGDYKARLQEFVREDDTFGEKALCKGTLMATVPRNYPGG